MVAVTPHYSLLPLLGCLLGAVLRQKEIDKTQPALSQPYLPQWYSSKFHHKIISVPSAARDISLPVEIALELSLFRITWALCISYSSICFPDKAPHVCVLGFLAKGHSDWWFLCFPLSRSRDCCFSALVSHCCLLVGTMIPKPASVPLLSIHVSGHLSPLDLFWVVPFLFEWNGC